MPWASPAQPKQPVSTMMLRLAGRVVGGPGSSLMTSLPLRISGNGVLGCCEGKGKLVVTGAGVGVTIAGCPSHATANKAVDTMIAVTRTWHTSLALEVLGVRPALGAVRSDDL